MKIAFYSHLWIMYMRCLEKICLITNASFNFLFYAMFGSDLRNQMKKCLLMIVCKKKTRRFSRWSSRTSSKISNLSSKTNRNRSNLSQKRDEKILYDIDENEENDMSQDDSLPPLTKVRQIYLRLFSLFYFHFYLKFYQVLKGCFIINIGFYNYY